MGRHLQPSEEPPIPGTRDITEREFDEGITYEISAAYTWPQLIANHLRAFCKLAGLYTAFLSLVLVFIYAAGLLGIALTYVAGTMGELTSWIWIKQALGMLPFLLIGYALFFLYWGHSLWKMRRFTRRWSIAVRDGRLHMTEVHPFGRRTTHRISPDALISLQVDPATGAVPAMPDETAPHEITIATDDDIHALGSGLTRECAQTLVDQLRHDLDTTPDD